VDVPEPLPCDESSVEPRVSRLTNLPAFVSTLTAVGDVRAPWYPYMRSSMALKSGDVSVFPLARADGCDVPASTESSDEASGLTNFSFCM